MASEAYLDVVGSVARGLPRAYREAARVPCTRCLAEIGVACKNPSTGRQRQAPCWQRVRDARGR
ncbi:zinc finger domain-containing protein [Mycobacterium paraense]|uniref:zinc finger domain-containing protein n=1 Tax=Mycobacterium paraense TaxID=767916 RepID=UPI003B986449